MSDAAAMTGLPRAACPASAPVLPLTARGLTLRFGETTVIDGLDLDLGPSGCTMILGPNGSGKSLLLKLLHGLIKPTAGQIAWGGQPPGAVTARQALVFQKPVLLRRTVAANLDFVLKSRGHDRARLAALLTMSGWPTRPASPRGYSRAARRSVWRWPVRWPRTRRSCSSTSPRPASTRPRCSPSSRSSPTPAIAASGSSSSATTSARPAAWPTRWCSSIAAGWPSTPPPPPSFPSRRARRRGTI